MLIVDPVIVKPWLAAWADAKAEIASLLSKASEAKSKAAKTRTSDQAEAAYRAFLDRLRNFRVLDPACGSGNFLYLALLALKDLEHRASIEAEALGLHREFPQVSPASVKGIEINLYAAELARVSVWVGEIQWMRRNGFGVSRGPILKPLDTIECRDAVLDAHGREAVWPSADVIIGNPPFLGNKKMIGALGEVYTKALRTAYTSRLSGGTDLVAYWFLKAWEAVERGDVHRAGLVATNSMRAGANRKLLTRIVNGGRIFDAWDDEPWVVDGASVRVSLICFEREAKGTAILDGQPVAHINPDLTASAFDLTSARQLRENQKISFVGVILNGEFEVDGAVARKWLLEPRNVNGRPNADVLRPTLNGDDFNGERPDKWVVDFGTDRSEAEAAFYQSPFGYIEARVKPFRQRKNPQGEYVVRAKNEREIWWRHARSRRAMRKALEPLELYVATPMVSSYRTFGFLSTKVLPDQKLVVFARDDECFLGILQSRVHEAWTKGTCSWIGAGNDVTYANQAVFLTFPFPEGLTPDIPAATYANDGRATAIAQAMHELNRLRDAWLTPDELVNHVPEVTPEFPERRIPVDAKAAEILKERTLGNLYAEQPTWLVNAHRALDHAVIAAYGWQSGMTDDEIVSRLLELNHTRPSLNGHDPEESNEE
jgi:type II restriction/modification system DNA methylase subunit YeeA